MGKEKFKCSHTDVKKVSELLLIQNPKNNNKHSKEQIDRLAKIIDFQGQRSPIVISKRSGFIVKGHGRLFALDKLKWSEAAVDYQDYNTEAEEYADMTADNEIARWAEFNTDKFLEDIKTVDLGDFELLGLKELPDILGEDKKELTDPDEIPEVVEPKAKLGQIYKLGEHRLMCGDSTSIDAVEKLMNVERADMVFTDPPYGVDYEGIKNDDRNGLFSLLDSVFNNYVRSIKQGSSIYCFHSDKCADIFHNVFRKYFHFSSMIIWLKPSLVMGQSDYQSKHEPCLYGWEKSGKHVWYSDRKQTSIIESGREKVDGHTTPKPVDFIEKCINNSSKSNQSILDLFGGSGSTLIACEKTNRKCFMMELDPHYVDVIITRWENFTGKKAELLNG